MAWDDFHVGRQLPDHLLDCIDHAVDAASAVNINEREAVGHEVVAHVHDVRFGEEDNRIAVRMACRKEESSNVLAIQMHGHVVIEGDNRQRLFGGRLDLHVY